jgi:hypothetical protein
MTSGNYSGFQAIIQEPKIALILGFTSKQFTNVQCCFHIASQPLILLCRHLVAWTMAFAQSFQVTWMEWIMDGIS